MPLFDYISQFTSYFSLQGLSVNWLDAVLIAVFIFYVFEGFQVGFKNALSDFLSFVLSFIVATRVYGILGGLLSSLFSISLGFANAIGFFIVAFVSEIIFNILIRLVTHRAFIPFVKQRPRPPQNKPTRATINNIAGIVPGIASAFVLLSFLLTLIISLPLSPLLKRTISSSFLASTMVSHTQAFEKTINSVFGGAVQDTLNFLTVEPDSSESVALRFKTTNVTPDDEAEQEMFKLVNKERTSRGIAPLEFDFDLREVARAHSRDMFAKGYFSHITPDGLSPFDRMIRANIAFEAAGENLALSPNVELGMQGLMNSPGHKANILSPSFKKIGIGVMDGGIYGEMFSQEFTD